MSSRSRLLGYGTAGALIVAGIVCAVFVSGFAGQLLAYVLMALGFVLGVALVFLEIGYSEDREREREEQQRAAERISGMTRLGSHDRPGRRLPRRRRRPG